MKIIKSGSVDWQDGADYFKKVLLDANEKKVGSFIIQEVRIKSGAITKKHYHRQQTEIFYTLNNQGYFIVNDNNIRLEAGGFASS